MYNISHKEKYPIPTGLNNLALFDTNLYFQNYRKHYLEIFRMTKWQDAGSKEIRIVSLSWKHNKVLVWEDLWKFDKFLKMIIDHLKLVIYIAALNTLKPLSESQHIAPLIFFYKTLFTHKRGLCLCVNV